MRSSQISQFILHLRSIVVIERLQSCNTPLLNVSRSKWFVAGHLFGFENLQTLVQMTCTSDNRRVATMNRSGAHNAYIALYDGQILSKASQFRKRGYLEFKNTIGISPPDNHSPICAPPRSSLTTTLLMFLMMMDRTPSFHSLASVM